MVAITRYVDTHDTTLDREYVWGLRYIDDLVRRARDTTGNGTLDEQLFALNDRQFNVVALWDATAASGAGAIVERFTYDPYGNPLFLNENFTTKAASTYAWNTLFQGLHRDEESNLYNNRRRILHALLGRFLQRDPLGYPDGLNSYAAYHVLNGKVDPYAREEESPTPVPGTYEPGRPGGPFVPDERRRNRDRYTFRNNFRAGHEEFQELSEMIEAKCEACCEDNPDCSTGQCAETAQKIEDQILFAWDEWWGQDNEIESRPILPQPGDGRRNQRPEHCGGYFCYDWSRIFYNAIASQNLGCVLIEDIKYYYSGYIQDPKLPEGSFRVHAFLDIYVCGNRSEECRISIDDGFFADTGLVHDEKWPPFDDRDEVCPSTDVPLYVPKPPGEGLIPIVD